MRDPFARATKSILGVLGKDALLRGAPAGKVNIEHDVEVYERNGEGEALFKRSIATIEAAYSPKQGDALVLMDDRGNAIESYKLGRLYEGDKFSRRHVVLEV